MTSDTSIDVGRSGGAHLKVPKMAELVATDIRRKIIHGELVAGSSLPPEAEMMSFYDVSRPTLREALRVLEAEQLVIPRRGSRGGARVALPSTEVASRYLALLLQVRGATYGELYDLRLILEPPAARLLARQRSSRTLDKLRRAYDDEEAVLDDHARFFEASARFHEQVVELSGSTPLDIFAEVLSDILANQHATPESGDGPADQNKRARQAHAAHKRFLGFVEGRDGDAAEEFWTRHLIAIGPYYALGSNQPVDLI